MPLCILSRIPGEPRTIGTIPIGRVKEPRSYAGWHDIDGRSRAACSETGDQLAALFARWKYRRMPKVECQRQYHDANERNFDCIVVSCRSPEKICSRSKP